MERAGRARSALVGTPRARARGRARRPGARTACARARRRPGGRSAARYRARPARARPTRTSRSSASSGSSGNSTDSGRKAPIRYKVPSVRGPRSRPARPDLPRGGCDRLGRLESCSRAQRTRSTSGWTRGSCGGGRSCLQSRRICRRSRSRPLRRSRTTSGSRSATSWRVAIQTVVLVMLDVAIGPKSTLTTRAASAPARARGPPRDRRPRDHGDGAQLPSSHSLGRVEPAALQLRSPRRWPSGSPVESRGGLPWHDFWRGAGGQEEPRRHSKAVAAKKMSLAAPRPVHPRCNRDARRWHRARALRCEDRRHVDLPGVIFGATILPPRPHCPSSPRGSPL